MNYYTNKPSTAFWGKSISRSIERRSIFGTTSRISNVDEKSFMSLGSCFAQHVSHALVTSGLKYLRAAEVGENSFFSANYGNVYTSLQFLQLVQQAYNLREFRDLPCWTRNTSNGLTYVDPFRPLVDSATSTTLEDVYVSRESHLSAVRSTLSEADYIIFTLGLNELWIHRDTGHVVPHAPGTVAQADGMDCYSSLTLESPAVCQQILDAMQIINANRQSPAHLIITVSPVPMIATHQSRHVLVSNTASKSVLRGAVEMILTRSPLDVTYFPSFEYVMDPRFINQNFEDDLRSVKASVVKNIMGHFLEFIGFLSPSPPSVNEDGLLGGGVKAVGDGAGLGYEVTCDDEIVELTLRNSGFGN